MKLPTRKRLALLLLLLSLGLVGVQSASAGDGVRCSGFCGGRIVEPPPGQ